MLGDYVAGHRKVTRFIPASEWAPVLAGLKAPLGVHAILGNHDWWEDKTVQREGKGLTRRPPRARSRGHSGLRKRRQAPDQGRPSVLARRPRRSAGLYAGAPLPPGAAHRRRRSRRDAWKVTDDAPVVLLAHEPDVARRVPARVALQLSGHTHGGQVRLFGWSPVAPSGPRLTYGHIRMNCDVVVSGGLGCSIMPFRLGVPPGDRAGDAGRRRGRRSRNPRRLRVKRILRKTIAFQTIEGRT